MHKKTDREKVVAAMSNNEKRNETIANMHGHINMLTTSIRNELESTGCTGFEDL